MKKHFLFPFLLVGALLLTMLVESCAKDSLIKWAAPNRFTCTTLVWWYAKKAYGVNVSSWYFPLVTPSGLFTDNCTYIRANAL